MVDKTITIISVIILALVIIATIMFVVIVYMFEERPKDSRSQRNNPDARQITFIPTQITDNESYTAVPSGATQKIRYSAGINTSSTVTEVQQCNVIGLSNQQHVTTTTAPTTTASRIVCAPFHANRVMIITPQATGTASRISYISTDIRTVTGETNPTYSGIASDSSGNSYCAPYNSNYVLVISSGNSISAVQYLSTNQPSDYTRTTRAYQGVVYHQNRLFFAPYGANYIMMYEIGAGNTGTTIGPALTNDNCGAGDHRYSGAVVRGNNIYFIPSNASYVMKLDTTMIGNNGNGNNNGNNSAVTFLPTDISQQIHTTSRYFGGTLNSSNNIICSPDNADLIMIISASDSISYIDSKMSGIHLDTKASYFRNGALLPGDNRVYMAPFHASNAIGVMGQDTIRVPKSLHPDTDDSDHISTYTDAVSYTSTQMVFIPGGADRVAIMTYDSNNENSGSN